MSARTVMQFKVNLTRGMDRWHGWQGARQKVRQVHFIQARDRDPTECRGGFINATIPLLSVLIAD